VQTGRGRSEIGREQVEWCLWREPSFASRCRFEEPGDWGSALEALNVPVLQLLCSTPGRDQCNATASALALLDLRPAGGPTRTSMPHHHAALGPSKSWPGAPIRGDHGAYGYRPIPSGSRLGSPSCCGLGGSCARTPPAPRKGVALVLRQLPQTATVGWPMGVGLDTPAQPRPVMLSWLQEAGHNLGAGPLPESGDALIRFAAGRAASNDPRKAATALPRPFCP